MSIKSLIQIIISILIIIIIGVVYYKYFNTKENIVEEIKIYENENSNQLKELEKKIFELEIKNKELSNKLDNDNIIYEKKNLKSLNSKNILNNGLTEPKEKNEQDKKIDIEEKLIPKQKIKNLVKDVEYTSIDQKGNRFYLLANSGKSNFDNNDILDLINVRGRKITSDIRDTIYIVSDFAEYNSVNLNSKFYENVIIDYQDKKITCKNFDINMETNKAIAYNSVIVTDPKSVMKAGIVEFDLKTRNININPENSTEAIKVITN